MIKTITELAIKNAERIEKIKVKSAMLNKDLFNGFYKQSQECFILTEIDNLNLKNSKCFSINIGEIGDFFDEIQEKHFKIIGSMKFCFYSVDLQRTFRSTKEENIKYFEGLSVNAIQMEADIIPINIK